MPTAILGRLRKFGIGLGSAAFARSTFRHNRLFRTTREYESYGNEMTSDDLHSFLTSNFDLVIDPLERGDGRSYFLRKVTWRPASTTRILRVQCNMDGRVSHIRLCVSSDNNNSVFVPMPIGWTALREVVAIEISLYGEYATNKLTKRGV